MRDTLDRANVNACAVSTDTKRSKHESMAQNYLEKRAMQAVVEDEVVGYMYAPRPFPLQHVELPSDVLNSATVVEPLVSC